MFVGGLSIILCGGCRQSAESEVGGYRIRNFPRRVNGIYLPGAQSFLELSVFGIAAAAVNAAGRGSTLNR